MAGPFDQLAAAALADAVIEVQIAGLPPLRVEAGGKGGGPLMRALRPRATVYLSGASVASVAPYGDPSVGFPTGLVLAAAAGAVFLGGVVLAIYGATR